MVSSLASVLPFFRGFYINGETMTRSTRNQPFCWQEKKILRLLKKKYKKHELSKYRNLYLTLTEINSDFNGKTIKYYTKTIATYSGLGRDWIPSALKEFENMGIIQVIQEKVSGKFKGKKLVFTPEKVAEIPLKTVIGETVDGETVIGNNDPSEDITIKKIVTNKEDNLLNSEKEKYPNRLLFNNTYYKYFEEHKKVQAHKSWYWVELQIFENYIKLNGIEWIKSQYNILLTSSWWKDKFNSMNSIVKVSADFNKPAAGCNSQGQSITNRVNPGNAARIPNQG